MFTKLLRSAQERKLRNFICIDIPQAMDTNTHLINKSVD